MKRVTTFAVCCLMIAALMGCNNYGKKIDYSNFEIYYTEAVTEADAKKVGDYIEKELKPEGDNKKSVQLDKSGDTYALRFVVKEGLDKDESAVQNFKAVARDVSAKVFNNGKVDVHLCDNKFKTLRVVSMN